MGSIYAKDICIGNTYAMDIGIRYFDIGDACSKVIYIKSASVKGVEPKVLAELEVTLVGSGVNNCYF